MPVWGYNKKYRNFWNFFKDQLVFAVFAWLILGPVLLLTIPVPTGAEAFLNKRVLVDPAYTPAERHGLFLFMLHLLGVAVLDVLVSLAIVAVGSFIAWVSLLARELKEIPGSRTKIQKLTWQERLGRYIDFRRCG